MKTTSTASVTSGQVDELCRMAESFAKSAVRTAVEQMMEAGELDHHGAQRVIGQGDRWKAKMITAYKTAIEKLSEAVTSCLRLISGGKKIIIRETSGQRLISQAKKVFPGWIDSDFTNWGCDVPGEARPETPVEVFEMTADADFRTMFGSFDCELDNLALTQNQIIAFVEDNEGWLHPDGWATFFLFGVRKKDNEGKEYKEFFVASVGRSAARLGVFVDRFVRGDVWSACRRCRVVVPQLSLGS